MKNYYVYILSNEYGVLYTGVTNDLMRRVYQHRTKVVPGFTANYNVGRLLYYEETGQINDALFRERQIKSWTRKKKLDLIRTKNPTFSDLAADWFDEE